MRSCGNLQGVAATLLSMRICSMLILVAVLAARAGAQAGASSSPTTLPASGNLVTMDFPADGIDVTVLADIVTRRLHIPILYDETIRGKKVVIRVPVKVPESALMGILQSALRMKQLALVDAEEPGWKQIVAAQTLAGVAKPVDAGVPAEGPIAQVFVLSHNDPSKVAEALRPFLTQPGGYVQAEAGQKVLILGDYPSVIRRVEPLIRKLDTEAPAVEVRFVTLKQAEAAQVATAVTQLLTSRETYQWGSGTLSGISLSPDERTNQIAIVAPPGRMQEIVALISELDKSPDLQTKVYHLRAVSPDHLDRLIKGLIGPALAKRAYQAVADPDSAALVVATTSEIHKQIADLLPQVDAALPESQNPIQFYKLKNTKAADVLATIAGLLGESANQEKPEEGTTGGAQPGGTPRGVGSTGGGVPSSRSQLSPDSTAALSPNPAGAAAALSGNAPTANPSMSAGAASSTVSSSGVSVGNASNLQYVSPALPYTNASSGSQGTPVTSVRGKNATVAADANSNSIIVVAPPPVQQMYAALIKRLDERRPQVQIECTIVTLDTSNGFTFGVDIAKLGGSDGNQILALSSFGISTVNPTTGRLTPVAAPGGTFALLSPHIADIVINALATNSRARFLSAPQLLVNDNGKGKLESVAQQPFAVILDASSVQSLTSLGGLASAGTTISVEPHISEADYLQLAYSIELSNFTGQASNGLPPPSQKNAVDSSVTIPDGYTIVVGGLTTKSTSSSASTIPILGDIPFLRWLFGTHTANDNQSTLFVFIRPVILRDDKFEDLKYISGKSARSADLPGDFPLSHPVPMR
ncbi:MAG TPA: secretin N-terminal domain-containing protein [Tepidisphaeraceae bacterium]|jgi:general secretion pathway protein D|nr:secretin N-terminal domain-containing protein [Tepidisphaeraceae bacterium]